ncbi:MAG TPA: sugar transferase [Gemmataceae bacterium]|jgi:lipopolysaccharide/colanic/teichoic acid biosynthesis glycosyltransferase|nr:sugar transferase [Gemmataceae bacterium]
MGKRLFDILFSLAVLILLGPFLLAVAALIKIGSPGPAFYRGERVGLGGRRFRIYKFRSMVVDADKKGASSTAEDDPRVTKIGRFLRKYKLDELPQFINVLAGDMSVVGPRPQVAWAVDLYTPEERKLLDVRPGVTDYASIRFRNEGEILRGYPDPDKAYLELIAPEKTRLGLDYVRHHSLAVDLKIIAMTFVSLFRKPAQVATPTTAP